MEQLIIIIMILLFTAGEPLVRWLKKQNAAGKAAAERGGRVVADEEDEEEEPWFEVLAEQNERFRPPDHFPKPVIVRVPPPSSEPIWFTPSAPLAAKAVSRTVPPTVARPTGARARGIPAHDWIRSPRDARRGIVLMTILGTPRGLE